LAEDAKLFMMCLLNLPRRDEQRVESLKSFLRYLYHKTPQDFVEICQQYLRVTSWFFHEVKVTDADQFFDVSKLNEARRNLEGEQGDYQHNIQFVLELLEICAEGNASNLKKLSPLLLIFYYIQNHRFPEIARRVISGMTGLNSWPPLPELLTYGVIAWALFVISFNINLYRVSRPECSVFSADRNYAKQISPIDSSVKVVPITCDRTFAACNLIAKNVQESFG
jgi:hypothetical protein